MEHDKCDCIIKIRPDYSSNLTEYWDIIQQSIKKTHGSIKDTDKKLMKIYLIERMMPEYSIVTLQEVTKKITQRIYHEKLKKSASKNFLKWVDKQLKMGGNIDL